MKTTVINVKKKVPYDVYIGRGSKWGNPFTHMPLGMTKAAFQVKTRQESIDKFKDYILNGDGKHLLNDLGEIKGKILGCYCAPKSCHGHILAELADKFEG